MQVTRTRKPSSCCLLSLSSCRFNRKCDVTCESQFFRSALNVSLQVKTSPDFLCSSSLQLFKTNHSLSLFLSFYLSVMSLQAQFIQKTPAQADAGRESRPGK